MENDEACKERKKCKVIALGASFVTHMLNTSSAAASICVQDCFDNPARKRLGRYLRNGCLHNPQQSFWMRVLHKGDNQEFFHFVSMSRSAFNELVSLLTPYILTHPQNRDFPKATRRTSAKRNYASKTEFRDI